MSEPKYIVKDEQDLKDFKAILKKYNINPDQVATVSKNIVDKVEVTYHRTFSSDEKILIPKDWGFRSVYIQEHKEDDLKFWSIHVVCEEFCLLFPGQSGPLFQLTINMLEKEVLLLKYELRHLTERTPSVVPINTLPPDDYEILRPILAALERVDDNYIVSLPEVDVSASGETPAAAIEAFKEMLIATAEILESTLDDSLSSRLTSNKHTMRQILKRKGHAIVAHK